MKHWEWVEGLFTEGTGPSKRRAWKYMCDCEGASWEKPKYGLFKETAVDAQKLCVRCKHRAKLVEHEAA